MQPRIGVAHHREQRVERESHDYRRPPKASDTKLAKLWIRRGEPAERDHKDSHHRESRNGLEHVGDGEYGTGRTRDSMSQDAERHTHERRDQHRHRRIGEVLCHPQTELRRDVAVLDRHAQVGQPAGEGERRDTHGCRQGDQPARGTGHARLATPRDDDRHGSERGKPGAAPDAVASESAHLPDRRGGRRAREGHDGHDDGGGERTSYQRHRPSASHERREKQRDPPCSQ